MADSTNRSYPPVGDPTRLDAILRRGRSLRRRRQLATGAGAGSAMAAAVVAVVLFTGAPGARPDRGLIADDPTTTVAPTTTAPTTTAPLTEMQVSIDTASSPVLVRVEDPAQPVHTGTDPPAQQCVMVTLQDPTGLAVAEGFACNFGGDEPVSVDLLVPAQQTQIGCAAMTLRTDPIERSTTAASSEFRVNLPAELPSGAYDLTVEATSGIGDGCAPASTGEVENVARADHPLTIP